MSFTLNPPILEAILDCSRYIYCLSSYKFNSNLISEVVLNIALEAYFQSFNRCANRLASLAA